ncbi:hypothetical protein JM946_18790 [Steroidobacter sp. S1-65]|uniref:EF-hand domain-containing protein n=1 Tax=Steroidobacter gossypii TaxID=2805490 RepID=A0ABS1X0M7_9GAMM|nr:hypothetical protein [Steroidobacter gossypii]MBM0106785.1 hypothetical protein [Steroidobacter gossypii]
MKALIALFAAALFTTAVADDQSKRDKTRDSSMRTSEVKFKQLDRDGDNQLSKAEAQSEDVLSARFSKVDSNSDGFLSKLEYENSENTDRPVTDR